MHVRNFTCYLMMLAAVISCGQKKPAGPKTIFGKDVAVGNGIVKSYIKLDKDGQPSSYGLTFSKSSLEGLPATGSIYSVPMPGENVTQIKHISFSYEPHNDHPIYDTPHISAGFYFISEEEKNTITDKAAAMDSLPADIYRPLHHVPTPGGIAREGKYWPDTTAEELHGIPFKRTIGFSSWNGKFISMETKLSMAFLKTEPKKDWPVEQMRAVQQTGYYATEYALTFDASSQTYNLSFDSLQLKTL